MVEIVVVWEVWSGVARAGVIHEAWKPKNLKVETFKRGLGVWWVVRHW